MVIRALKDINIDFLYYVLSDNSFFEYVTKSAKGTKMPRGDKNKIMQFNIAIFSYDIQQKIGNFLSKIDEKININNHINDNLEQQKAAFF